LSSDGVHIREPIVVIDPLLRFIRQATEPETRAPRHGRLDRRHVTEYRQVRGRVVHQARLVAQQGIQFNVDPLID